MTRRQGSVERRTKETAITIQLQLEGSGKVQVATGVPFFDHMLDLLGHHGAFDLTLKADGDLDVDPHHTVEDVGISFGQVFRQVIGDKKGIKRYGSAIVPMDEALARVALDVSGRPHLSYNVDLPPERIGSFDTHLILEFLHAFVNHSAITLHIKLLAGKNTHHMVEAVFKALGRALDEATRIDERKTGSVPSTKGKL